MSGAIFFVLLILTISGGIYYLIGRWASRELITKGYPNWVGWLVALTGLIPTFVIVHALPPKQTGRDWQLKMLAEAELAKSGIGSTQSSYGNLPPPVWSQRDGHPDSPVRREYGNSLAGAGGNDPKVQFASPRWVAPAERQVAGWAGAVNAEVPGSARECEACNFLIAPGKTVCPNCGFMAD